MRAPLFGYPGQDHRDSSAKISRHPVANARRAMDRAFKNVGLFIGRI